MAVLRFGIPKWKNNEREETFRLQFINQSIDEKYLRRCEIFGFFFVANLASIFFVRKMKGLWKYDDVIIVNLIVLLMDNRKGSGWTVFNFSYYLSLSLSLDLSNRILNDGDSLMMIRMMTTLVMTITEQFNQNKHIQ